MSMFDDTDLHEHQCENEVCGVVYSCSDPHCDTHFKYCPSCAELLGDSRSRRQRGAKSMIRVTTPDGRSMHFSAAKVLWLEEVASQLSKNQVQVYLDNGSRFFVRGPIDTITQQIEEEELAKA